MSKVSQQQRADCLRDWLIWMGKYPLMIVFFLSSIFLNAQIIGYKDSIITVCKDSIVKVPIYGQPSTSISGIYLHPNYCEIGNISSEDSWLKWAKREGANTINAYARSYLYTDAKRTQLAAFVKKAKEQYGFTKFTVDARFTSSSEKPGWIAYLAKYSNTISAINPLTEFEPWVKNSAGVYDYPHYFYLIRELYNICSPYGIPVEYYIGWIGSNYSNPQAAVDSMIKYCDLIYISNYVSQSDYYSTSTSLGMWDNRMDKRCAQIAKASIKYGKTGIVEIISLELKKWGAGNDFLGLVYACPASSTNQCNPFFNTTKAISEYNKSTAEILGNTFYKGRTIFYDKFGILAHPK
jgi:hypothetical protein